VIERAQTRPVRSERLPDPALAVRVGDALAGATSTLATAGSDSPRLDAELLLAAVLGIDRARLLMESRMPLAPDPLRRYEELIARRAAREPVAYILGRKDFRRISLSVDRRVLIPRPETELLVEVGLSLAPGARVADVGTGSGAIALALKDERPDLDVWGIDLSKGAVAVARDNALRLGLAAQFVVADLLSGVDVEFDAVLANLPYVAEDEVLAPEIAVYEPAPALFAGPAGLDLIGRLVEMAASVPLLGLEVGFDQAAAVDAMLRRAGWRSVDRLRDLAGHERVVVGRR
jgi:release factor glutamine methyltransferase